MFGTAHAVWRSKYLCVISAAIACSRSAHCYQNSSATSTRHERRQVPLRSSWASYFRSVRVAQGLSSGSGGSESEQLADEKCLADRIFFRQPFHSSSPDHVHRLDSLQRPPRTLKSPVANHTRFFTDLWSCSITLLRYLH